MRTFSELLREHVARAGVPDAELARAVGVQRQTVFRWKEGLVARPRSAEDVLRLSAKLRLTPAERDELLLAAGFPPVEMPVVSEAVEESAGAVEPTEATLGTQVKSVAINATADASQSATEGYPSTPLHSAQDAPQLRTETHHRRPFLLVVSLVAALLIAAAIFLALRPRYPQAAAGETLILVAQFGNYTGGAQGYNVAGRLAEALERELDAAGLRDARVAAWPAAVTDAQTAADALARSRAALLVWGEYDSGRLVARFLRQEGPAPTATELALLAATPAELPAVINAGVPGDMRYLALDSLAHVYLQGGKIDAARAALGQAGLNLPEDAGTRAGHYFLWGYVNQIGQPPDLDAVIQGYTDALALDDSLDAARSNRAIAYLKRQAPGDLPAAVEDLSRYIELHRDDPAARNNRGSAYFYLGGAENAQRALEDFNRAVELAPQDVTGYYNRGLAHIRLDQTAAWQADLGRALEGEHPRALVALCWGYSLSAEPQTAVDYCRQAAEGGDAGSWENLAVAYARSGVIDEALAALEKFRATPQGAAKLAEVDAWLAALKNRENPFDAEALRRLREE